MKSLTGVLAIVLALAGVCAGQAASPEQDYVAARDAAVARVKKLFDAPKPDNDALTAADDKALADLETRLRTVVGPVSIAGYGPAKSNLETLQPELGFGYLDGLVVRSADEKSSIIVTTEPLFMNWLRLHKNWWQDTAMPQTAAAAVALDAFYTQATGSDAAVVSYGTLPVAKPEGAALAYAILAARTQDQSPAAPDQMFVVVVKGGKVFVGNTPLAKDITPDPSCTALRAEFHARAEKAFADYNAGGLKDTKLTDRAEALEREGDEKQRRCVGEKMSTDARSGATKQAQDYIGLMTGK